MDREALKPLTMRSFGGRHWTFAWWRRPRFNWYLRLGSRSVFWRQP